MGASMCCMKQPSSSEQQANEVTMSSPEQFATPALSFLDTINSESLKQDKVRLQMYSEENERTIRGDSTLEQFLLASPATNPSCLIGSDLQVFKPFPKKVHPSSPEVHTEFFTPRISFSSEKRGLLGKIEEEDESEVSVTPVLSRTGSGKLKKKVTFKMPEEADIIIFYSPREIFEE